MPIQLKAHIDLKSRPQTSNDIISALTKEINVVLSTSSIRQKIINKARELFATYLRIQPEVESLINTDGTLRHEIGLVNGQAAIDELIKIWVETINVDILPVRKYGLNIRGGLTIYGIYADFADVLNSGAASYLTEKSQKISWLEWLLLLGDNIIVNNYFYTSNLKLSRFSRTGYGVMVKRQSTSWNVPPEFSGTPDDNFVTRAIDNMIPTLIDDISDQMRMI